MHQLSLASEPAHHCQLPIKALARLYAEGFSSPPWNEDWTVESAEAELLKTVGTADYLIARRDEQIAGFGIGSLLLDYEGAEQILQLGAQSGAYYIRELVTDSRFRRRGVCLGICAEFEQLARETGCAALVLRTREDNLALFGVLERLGMSPLGRYLVTTGQKSHTSVVFSKKF